MRAGLRARPSRGWRRSVPGRAHRQGGRHRSPRIPLRGGRGARARRRLRPRPQGGQAARSRRSAASTTSSTGPIGSKFIPTRSRAASGCWSIDDLIATGGTAEATIHLIDNIGAEDRRLRIRDRSARPGWEQVESKRTGYRVSYRCAPSRASRRRRLHGLNEVKVDGVALSHVSGVADDGWSVEIIDQTEPPARVRRAKAAAPSPPPPPPSRPCRSAARL